MNTYSPCHADIKHILGQEKNITTYNLARMNMLLHGVKDSEFEIYHGDTLTNDWDSLREINPARMPKFDAVVNVPWGCGSGSSSASYRTSAMTVAVFLLTCRSWHVSPPLKKRARVCSHPRLRLQVSPFEKGG